MNSDRKIDFFIVGAQKAGTTSLYDHIARHPELFLPSGKDFYAFNDDPLYGVSGSGLLPYYREYRGQRLIGGSNVQIMRFPSAVRNLHQYNPRTKLIILLRNPVDRAYSAFWMMRNLGLEPCDTFEAALAQDGARAERGDFRENAELRYLEPGYYDEQIDFIHGLFDSGSIYIGLFDDFVRQPERITREILDWLGAETSGLAIDFSKRSNEASRPRSMMLQRIIRSQNRLKKFYRSVVPLGARDRLNAAIFSKLQARNLAPFKYPEMAAETRSRLVEHFLPHNRRLSELIDRDLSHWL